MTSESPCLHPARDKHSFSKGNDTKRMDIFFEGPSPPFFAHSEKFNFFEKPKMMITRSAAPTNNGLPEQEGFSEALQRKRSTPDTIIRTRKSTPLPVVRRATRQQRHTHIIHSLLAVHWIRSKTGPVLVLTIGRSILFELQYHHQPLLWIGCDLNGSGR